MKTIQIEKHAPSRSAPREPDRRARGFTLVELLVVITIIVVLAALVFTATRQAMMGAKKAVTVGQMRSVAAGVAAWAAEINNNEPMYFNDGTGDNGQESAPGADPRLSPGNPAKALYNKDDVQKCYIQDFSVFFSPLSGYKVPDREVYDPSKASMTSLWGTYIWVYPCVPSKGETPRQLGAMHANTLANTIIPEAYNKISMVHCYNHPSLPEPKRKNISFALFVDGSVKQVPDDVMAWIQGK